MEATPVTKAPADKALARPESRAKPHGAGTAASAGAASQTSAVEISLTEAGEKAIQVAGSGKAGRSPAHQAHAFLAGRAAESETGAKVPFGQVVSRIARGLDPAEAFAEPAEAGAEDDLPPVEGEGTDAVAEDAPAPAVEAADTGTDALLAELLDDLSEPEEQAG